MGKGLGSMLGLLEKCERGHTCDLWSEERATTYSELLQSVPPGGRGGTPGYGDIQPFLPI
eukprot:scaffold42859_cov36-Cyclotella_meneghiniana.AAC.3